MLGNVREAMVLLPAAQLIDHLWQMLAPTIAIMRRRRGKQLYCSFEYVAARARLWNQRYPDGYTPKGFVRSPIADIWREADQRSV